MELIQLIWASHRPWFSLISERFWFTLFSLVKANFYRLILDLPYQEKIYPIGNRYITTMQYIFFFSQLQTIERTNLVSYHFIFIDLASFSK